jgi:histone H3/H4
VLGILLSGQLLTNCILEGEKSVATFKSFTKDEDNYVAKNAKAGIIFPPNLVDKFLKKHHISYSQINHVSIYIASVCEYIIHEILDTAVDVVNQKKRIDVYDLNLAVKKDNELSCLFNTLNVSFLIAEPKSILCKSSFERLVRKYASHAKLTKNTLDTLRIFIEKYTIELLSYSSSLATHGNRGRVLPCDIKLMYSIMNKMKGCEQVVSFPERPSAPDLLSL